MCSYSRQVHIVCVKWFKKKKKCCSSLVKTQIKLFVQCYHIIYNRWRFQSHADFTQPTSSLYSKKQMITVLSNRWHCIATRLSPVAALCQCCFRRLTWTSSLVSSHPNLTRAHVRSNVSFCFFCGLPSGNSITNVSSLVSVNGSYIKTPPKMPSGCLYHILYALIDTHLKKKKMHPK